jgi:hypothetical protein
MDVHDGTGIRQLKRQRDINSIWLTVRDALVLGDLDGKIAGLVDILGKNYHPAESDDYIYNLGVCSITFD